jgi:photoactive yellow protein
MSSSDPTPENVRPTGPALTNLDSLIDEEIDALPFGAIKVDGAGRVLFYSRAESQLSGRRADKVLGKNFFADIAPCTNTPAFAGAFFNGVARGHLDHVFEYIFDFDMAPVQVRIHMRDTSAPGIYWILVELMRELPEGSALPAQEALAAKLAGPDDHVANSFDYSACNDEPFEALGHVQSFGAILTVHPVSVIVQSASETLLALFGVEPTQLLGRPIGECLTAEASATVLRAFHSLNEASNPRHEFHLHAPFLCSTDALCRLYLWKGQWIIELEPWDERTPDLGATHASRLHTQLRALHSSRDKAALALDSVRELTGHARAIVYRIGEDGNGVVVAESRDGSMPALLNLHFPASDIPRRARELYVDVPVRYVPS